MVPINLQNLLTSHELIGSDDRSVDNEDQNFLEAFLRWSPTALRPSQGFDSDNLPKT
ncbi:hypothetical protein [Acaryochloris sp. IP29b_bin.148]|uniref:hypothetical protein n=1 Tax=Acaryochloris sp. IP29b_bin.148 TaxID=2969218 RepID=UPI00260A1F71|nr:hypothetical protein [Acaryochloris sp. IP29b_bin.148]